ncbi:MAG TPA: EAL domain-containing protein [Gemmatimonadales bacterium]|nr:EAL domain-containing protein [Gemmatimonadales bacterium]
MTGPVLLVDSVDPAVREAAALLSINEVRQAASRDLSAAIASGDSIFAVITTTDNPNALRDIVTAARARHIPVIVGAASEMLRRRAVEVRPDDWYRSPAPADEIAARVRAAVVRSYGLQSEDSDTSAADEREIALYDSLTGLPTLPVMIERCRRAIKDSGELEVIYLSFMRYAKLEEIYGWEKLDGVLETTAAAVQQVLDESGVPSSRLMVSFTNDDEFVLFSIPQAGADAASDADITKLASALREQVAASVEAVHGEDVAALFDIFVGRAHVHYNPKVRLQRLVYRGIREAASAARSVEERERARRVAELRAVIRDGLVYVDYHPIVHAASGQIYGYEALARGVLRSLRSPEVMFDIAAHADLLWELGRLCRQKAVEGMDSVLQDGELLFINVDPHDFADPQFDESSLHSADPERVVIEITERTAIKDYPRLRDRLQIFRERGFRFAVDDAGSGYAGLGSIANLEPDFIKLDMSLIHGIDSNFIKQNLVQTMVRFANEQGAMVIAEGVESEPEYATVHRLGVHLVQGFFLNSDAVERDMTSL